MGRRPRRDARRLERPFVILVDTSAWIEFLRATGSAHDQAVRAAIAAQSVLVPDVVRLELLAGAGSETRADEFSRMLASFASEATASPLDHDTASQLYRSARRSGHTVRSLFDCLVAAIALRVDAPVLARDRDFEALASVSQLVLVAVGETG